MSCNYLHLRLGCIGLVIFSCASIMDVMANEPFIIDDRSSGDYRSTHASSWRLITDGVMGGVSKGQLTADSVEGKACLRLRGDVSLENNGGFVQAALNLDDTGDFDASAYSGILLQAYGNNESYNLHLRTSDIRLPWQSYRASFTAPSGWHSLRLPFADFTGYRIDSPLNLKKLKRIGVVAIGRAFNADLCIASLVLYRNAPDNLEKKSE